jgi:ABC-type transporter Mla subunit MlaD
MQPWAQAVLVACAVLLTAAVVPAVLAVRRTARRAETVLTIVEQELRPLIGQLHALSEDVRTLTREAKEEIERVGEVTERVNAVADGVGRAVTGLAGLTRAGQLIGMAAGLKKGLDVFVSRFSKNQGDHHGQ